MRLTILVRVGAALLLAVALAACDGSENPRTLPTGAPEYISPSMIGPEVLEDHQAGESEEGHGEDESAGEGESHGEDQGGTVGAPESATTAANE